MTEEGSITVQIRLALDRLAQDTKDGFQNIQGFLERAEARAGAAGQQMGQKLGSGVLGATPYHPQLRFYFIRLPLQNLQVVTVACGSQEKQQFFRVRPVDDYGYETFAQADFFPNGENVYAVYYFDGFGVLRGVYRKATAGGKGDNIEIVKDEQLALREQFVFLNGVNLALLYRLPVRVRESCFRFFLSFPIKQNNQNNYSTYHGKDALPTIRNGRKGKIIMHKRAPYMHDKSD